MTFDDMTDAGLRDLIKDRTGRKPHPQSSRDVLLAKARALPLQQPDETPMSEASAATAEPIGDMGAFARVEDVPVNPDAAANIAAAMASAPAGDEARQAAVRAARAAAKTAAEQPQPTRLQKVGQNEELARAQKIERMQAAKRAARNGGVEADNPMVTVRVTKMGDMKVSTGEHVGQLGDIPYEFKETFQVRQDIALGLEERGFVEIQD